MNGRSESDVSARGIAIAVVVGFILAVGAAELILRFVMPEWREFYSGRFITTVDVPGYGATSIGRPNFDGFFSQNNGDFRTRITLNASGLRNADPLTAAGDRIWIVGDSMAFGWGVEADQMYSRVLERLIERKTYNLGSPGTDICGYQTMIARMPPELKPRAVVIGLILENDIRKYDCAADFAQAQRDAGTPRSEGSLSSFADLKYYLTQNSAIYNFFAVSLKRVAVVQKLLVTVGLIKEVHVVNNQVDPAEIESLAESAAYELGRLRGMLPAGMPMYVLIAPTRFEIRDDDAVFKKLRTTVADSLRRVGIGVIDPFPAFREAGFVATHFEHDGHWSALGHEAAARALAERLRPELQPDR